MVEKGLPHGRFSYGKGVFCFVFIFHCMPEKFIFVRVFEPSSSSGMGMVLVFQIQKNRERMDAIYLLLNAQILRSFEFTFEIADFMEPKIKYHNIAKVM